MKINKKILLTLVFLFTLSSTGLPFMLHYCTMGKEIKLESCAMCKTHAKEKTAQKQSDNNGAEISKIKQNCCSSKIMASPITEEYLSSKAEKTELKTSGLLIHIGPDYLKNHTTSHKTSQQTINSPPGLFVAIPIFITDSVFLI
ncbi:MAG: hypothetical protein WCJ01_08590 [Ignavibacteria bacterium]